MWMVREVSILSSMGFHRTLQNLKVSEVQREHQGSNPWNTDEWLEAKRNEKEAEWKMKVNF